jgi:hypothetical protein
VRPRHVDVRELEPPLPLVRALAAVQSLAADEYLVLHHRREPVPLYELLSAMGFAHQTRSAAADRFEIMIWRAAGPAPAIE